MERIKLFSLFFLLVLFETMRGQANLEVVTKTIEKNIAYKSGDNISITGENAAITINSWAKGEIKIKMKLISKHRVKSVAISKQESIKYRVEKKGNTIYVGNYFLNTGESVSGAILKVEYELMVPENSTIAIKNNLGNISVNNIEGLLNIEAKFGNIQFSNIKGDIRLNLSLGDIKANNISGNMNITSAHSNMKIENFSGRGKFKLSNGDLFIQPVNAVTALDVETKNGDVTCSISAMEDYNFDFNSSYGEITIPDIFKNKIKVEKNRSVFSNLDAKSKKPVLTIKVEFGNILLTK